MKRVLGSKSVTEIPLLCKSVVRPILEYAVPVWCPLLGKDMVLLLKGSKESNETGPRASLLRRGLFVLWAD